MVVYESCKRDSPIHFSRRKSVLRMASFEPGTCCVLGGWDNHCTMGTCSTFILPSILLRNARVTTFSHLSPQKLKYHIFRVKIGMDPKFFFIILYCHGIPTTERNFKALARLEVGKKWIARFETRQSS